MTSPSALAARPAIFTLRGWRLRRSLPRKPARVCTRLSGPKNSGATMNGRGRSSARRSLRRMVAALIGVGALMPPTAAAGPTVCDYPACTPGIAPNMVLGAPCDNTTYYAFGVSGGYVPATQPGRLMFCGSPRRYQPRWFRSPPMAGIKDENADCHLFLNYVAQSPDGLFLICIAEQGKSFWTRADT